MIHDHTLTKHADVRIRQRGLRDDDINLVLLTASSIGPDAYMLTAQDAAREIARRKHEIQTLERLKGCKLVVEGDSIISCYHADANAQKKTLRHGRMRC